MKCAPIVLIALFGIAGATPRIEAQNLTDTLVQTAKPITTTYPGVNANILGIRTGMTVSQAEAIAAKTFSVKPQVTKNSLTANYRRVYMRSQSFISELKYLDLTGNVLTLQFSSPALGNTLYGIDLTHVFTKPSRAPFMYAEASALIKQYGPVSSETPPSYWWQFGKSSLVKCPRGPCPVGPVGKASPHKPASQKPVIMEISASLSPDDAYYVPPTPGHKNGRKVANVNIVLFDYQAERASENAAMSQLKTAAIDYYNKTTEAKTEALKRLTKNAKNILDVTGLVTAHALVLGCENDGVVAQTVSSANATLPTLEKLPKGVFRKYRLGPVTYAGKTYNVRLEAFGKPPRTTNADAYLEPLKGQGGKEIRSGNTIVSGSITVARFGSSVAFTFNHAALTLVSPTLPRNATLTFNGKAYCNGSSAPLP